MCSEQAQKARNKASKNKNPLLPIAETNNLDVPDNQGMQKSSTLNTINSINNSSIFNSDNYVNNPSDLITSFYSDNNHC